MNKNFLIVYAIFYFSNLLGNNAKELGKIPAPMPKQRDHQQYKSMQKLPRSKIPSKQAKREDLLGKKATSKKKNC
ncbi:MAG TPA: hypothetical protein VHO47_03610 [Candidatus Babeliales bacterium]|nr:hypothetical protein [Candidatus Babeliales bacterium]